MNFIGDWICRVPSSSFDSTRTIAIAHTRNRSKVRAAKGKAEPPEQHATDIDGSTRAGSYTSDPSIPKRCEICPYVISFCHHSNTHPNPTQTKGALLNAAFRRRPIPRMQHRIGNGMFEMLFGCLLVPYLFHHHSSPISCHL